MNVTEYTGISHLKFGFHFAGQVSIAKRTDTEALDALEELLESYSFEYPDDWINYGTRRTVKIYASISRGGSV